MGIAPPIPHSRSAVRSVANRTAVRESTTPWPPSADGVEPPITLYPISRLFGEKFWVSGTLFPGNSPSFPHPVPHLFAISGHRRVSSFPGKVPSFRLEVRIPYQNGAPSSPSPGDPPSEEKMSDPPFPRLFPSLPERQGRRPGIPPPAEDVHR